MGRHEIYHPANERQAHRARQRGEHIKPPELAVAQPERRLPFRNRRGNEECLPETRKVREHETAGDPTEVAPYECKQGIFVWLGVKVRSQLEHISAVNSPCFCKLSSDRGWDSI